MSETSPISILIIEDQPITRLGLRMTLEQCDDFSVVGESEDGFDAVETALTKKPSIILLDIGLPGIDGLEVMKRIKSSLPSTRVIMFTSHDSPDEIFRALRAGAQGYCLKTVGPEALIECVYSVAKGSLYLDAPIAQSIFKEFTGGETNGREPKDKPASSQMSGEELELLSAFAAGIPEAKVAEQLKMGVDPLRSCIQRIIEKASGAYVDDTSS